MGGSGGRVERRSLPDDSHRQHTGARGLYSGKDVMAPTASREGTAHDCRWSRAQRPVTPLSASALTVRATLLPILAVSICAIGGAQLAAAAGSLQDLSEMTVNDPDGIGMPGDNLPQVEMDLAALEALVIRIHLDFDFGVHCPDPGMAFCGQARRNTV